MKIKLFLTAAAFILAMALPAQNEPERYIEVTGTSEVEIVPDKIHYLIEISEYFEEEFDGKSKPEEYRTKVPLNLIERKLRSSLMMAGVTDSHIRTQEVGDYWRKQGQDFLVTKMFDVTLTDFRQINEIVNRVDTKGIRSMRIGELENKDIRAYHEKGKIEALKAARHKATYLVEAMGKKLGGVLRIVEEPNTAPGAMFAAQSNVSASNAASFDGFRTIKRNYSILVRFEITD